jgi:quercetin dioxygenase-like cupin family protein
MNLKSDQHDQEHLDLVLLYALRTLQAGEIAAAENLISACADCRQEAEALRPVIGSFAFWPTDVLRPSSSLWERLARRIADETGAEPVPAPKKAVPQPEWEDVAPGIACKLLATDSAKNRVSMLVRLAPGTDYPPHRHAGVEELHLLQGQLIVNEKTLHPGDYIRAGADTVDHRVWSESGCTCVLITSTLDVLTGS